MSVVIIGVDPGLSTGVAEIVDGRMVRIFQGPGGQAMDLLELILGEHSGHTDRRVSVACERFIQGSQAHSHQPEAQQIVGLVLRAGEKHDVTVDLQAPSDALAIGQGPLLQRAGLWPLPSDVQQADADDVRMAVRHAVLYMARHHASLFQRLVRSALID
jgi:hypothetical protein